jgi:hypothetical protein
MTVTYKQYILYIIFNNLFTNHVTVGIRRPRGKGLDPGECVVVTGPIRFAEAQVQVSVV